MRTKLKRRGSALVRPLLTERLLLREFTGFIEVKLLHSPAPLRRVMCARMVN